MSAKIISIAAVLVVATAQAQTPPGGASNLDQSPLFSSVDANKDGKATKAEWLASGAPEMVLGIVDANKDDVVTLAELSASSPPADVDTNKDGKVTLDELKAMMANMGGAGGQPPAGSPPDGAPPAAK